MDLITRLGRRMELGPSKCLKLVSTLDDGAGHSPSSLIYHTCTPLEKRDARHLLLFGGSNHNRQAQGGQAYVLDLLALRCGMTPQTGLNHHSGGSSTGPLPSSCGALWWWTGSDGMSGVVDFGMQVGLPVDRRRGAGAADPAHHGRRLPGGERLGGSRGG
jgi:hypothetical protein